jgi:hypothetical protein
VIDQVHQGGARSADEHRDFKRQHLGHRGSPRYHALGLGTKIIRPHFYKSFYLQGWKSLDSKHSQHMIHRA